MCPLPWRCEHQTGSVSKCLRRASAHNQAPAHPVPIKCAYVTVPPLLKGEDVAASVSILGVTVVAYLIRRRVAISARGFAYARLGR